MTTLFCRLLHSYCLRHLLLFFASNVNRIVIPSCDFGKESKERRKRETVGVWVWYKTKFCGHNCRERYNDWRHSECEWDTWFWWQRSHKMMWSTGYSTDDSISKLNWDLFFRCASFNYFKLRRKKTNHELLSFLRGEKIGCREQNCSMLKMWLQN